MTTLRPGGYTAAALCAALVLTLGAAAPEPAAVKSRVMPIPVATSVNVSVNFNMVMPLEDISEKTVVAAQDSGRRLIYRMASQECTVLTATIAKTCRLVSINVSTRIQEARHNNPPRLTINGSSRFQVTLK